MEYCCDLTTVLPSAANGEGIQSWFIQSTVLWKTRLYFYLIKGVRPPVVRLIIIISPTAFKMGTLVDSFVRLLTMRDL